MKITADCALLCKIDFFFLFVQQTNNDKEESKKTDLAFVSVVTRCGQVVAYVQIERRDEPTPGSLWDSPWSRHVTPCHCGAWPSCG